MHRVNGTAAAVAETGLPTKNKVLPCNTYTCPHVEHAAGIAGVIPTRAKRELSKKTVLAFG